MKKLSVLFVAKECSDVSGNKLAGLHFSKGRYATKQV
jgi:hypothetical protein